MLYRRIMSVAASAGLVCLFAVATPRSAEAQIVDGLLGFLGVHDEKPEVEYRERAPLVVPPKNALRPPQESASAKHAAWPKDPDVQRRKAAAATARMPVTETEEYKRQMNPHLPIDQMRAGRKAGAGIPNEPAPVFGDNSREANWIHPDNLRAMHAKAQQAGGNNGPTVACDGREEAPRRYLTEPPTGLRKCVAGFQGRTTRGAVNAKSNDNEEASPYAVLTKKPASEE
jgi:hypothetical protein